MANLSDIRIQVGESEIGNFGAQKRLRATAPHEVYRGYIKTQTPRLTKEKETTPGGNMQILLQLAPVDGEGKTRFPTAPVFLPVPVATPPEVFEALGENPVSTKGEQRGQKVSEYAFSQAYDLLSNVGLSDIAAPLPKWDKEAKVWRDQLTDAVYTTAEAKQARVRELAKPVSQYMLDAFLHPTETSLVGATVAFELSYGKDGKGFPSVKIVANGDDIPDTKVVIEDINGATEAG